MNSKKRIITEWQKLQKLPSDFFYAAPLEDNLFEWHFTLKGPENSPYEGGLFHGKVMLPEGYPIKPPDFIFLTPNGRFDIGRKICLSNSSYHPESWSPLWTIRNMIESILMIFPTNDVSGLGHLNTPVNLIRKFVDESKNWKCTCCGTNENSIKKLDELLQQNKCNQTSETTVKNVLNKRTPIDTIAGSIQKKQNSSVKKTLEENSSELPKNNTNQVETVLNLNENNTENSTYQGNNNQNPVEKCVKNSGEKFDDGIKENPMNIEINNTISIRHTEVKQEPDNNILQPLIANMGEKYKNKTVLSNSTITTKRQKVTDVQIGDPKKSNCCCN